MGDSISRDDILAAHHRIASMVHRTPVLRCRTLDELAGREVWLKCENFQRVGAFKFRGASNAVARLSDAVALRGVVTHSSGNHAQALALAARLRGIPAWIVMPTDAPAPKRAAVAGYGAQVVACEPTLAAREATAARVVCETGGTLIPPYDHPDVIAGQGTIALEVLEQCPGIVGIVVPVGGGGMASGIAIATHGLVPRIRIVAGEPRNADDAARGKALGSPQPLATTQTIADGLRTSLGRLTFPIVRDLVDEIVTVAEAEIAAALRLVLERAKLVIEPSSAVAVAAVLCGRSATLRTTHGPIAVVLSGGNLDLDAAPWRDPEPPAAPSS